MLQEFVGSDFVYELFLYFFLWAEADFLFTFVPSEFHSPFLFIFLEGGDFFPLEKSE